MDSDELSQKILEKVVSRIREHSFWLKLEKEKNKFEILSIEYFLANQTENKERMKEVYGEAQLDVEYWTEGKDSVYFTYATELSFSYLKEELKEYGIG